MASLNGFNAAEVSPESQYSPIPAGTYEVIITESELKDTKAGTGQYLQLVLEVVDGEFKGRKVWDRLNIVNQNMTAQEIGQRALSQICHAVGVLAPNDSNELHHKPLMAKITVRLDPQYGDSNEVKEYSAASGGGSQPQTTQAPAQAAAQAVNRPNFG